MGKRIITAIVSGALFAGLIYLLKNYDVAAIGPNNTSVGCSSINKMVHDLTGVNMLWYDITDYIGYFALCICAFFGLIGLIQLIRRRSLLKVDRTIICLGVLYIVVIGLYMLFEKVIINYRPVIMPGETAPEASFPSSHTMLIITVMASTSLVIGQYVKNKRISSLISLLCYLIIFVTVLGRLYCGVHWFTDIIGGVLLSVTVFELFSAAFHTYGGRYRGSKAGHISSGDKSMHGYRPKH